MSWPTEAQRSSIRRPRRGAHGGGGDLSYRRTAEPFERASGGATPHRIRHSALTHAAEGGAGTSTLLASCGPASVASLARYARVSAEAPAAWQAGREPARGR
ncbi:hypothetical protein ACFO4E_20150 [Nocardiopsis mangrovi]|uniref:Tyr recombinase domain-containing protein n=1 Tax=Nocardiopsis mangrovi TaxID=1179818 RepID=A0ABV9DZ46_9ACTN